MKVTPLYVVAAEAAAVVALEQFDAVVALTQFEDTEFVVEAAVAAVAEAALAPVVEGVPEAFVEAADDVAVIVVAVVPFQVPPLVESIVARKQAAVAVEG